MSLIDSYPAGWLGLRRCRGGLLWMEVLVVGLLGRRAAVVGVYTTEHARNMSRTPFSLQLEAIKGAVADAGLTMADVDGLAPNIGSDHHNPAPMMNSSLAHMFWAEQLGGRPLKVVVHGGGSAQLSKAAGVVSAGMADVVVVFFGKSAFATGPSHYADAPPGALRVLEWDALPHGGYLVTWYALWAQRYMHEFGISKEDLSEIPVVTRHYATLNPASVMGHKGELTVEDVMTSKEICSPLNLYDCSGDNDGGYALVVASEEVARNTPNPVWILGAAESYYSDFYASIPDPWFSEEGLSVKHAADQAFEMAGVSRDEIDVANLYDCFSITMARDLEEMGFCKPGEGVAFVKDGQTRLGGSLPSNTDGGLLSGSHCGEPSGMPTIEVVRQLRGQCGERQVPNAKLGVSLSQGFSVHGVAGVLVLGTEEPDK
jgi:acetyl-CoA C-acetyltransferase